MEFHVRLSWLRILRILAGNSKRLQSWTVHHLLFLGGSVSVRRYILRTVLILFRKESVYLGQHTTFGSNKTHNFFYCWPPHPQSP